jgi:alpha-tubulin suppressor-like RCC1 family protein
MARRYGTFLQALTLLGIVSCGDESTNPGPSGPIASLEVVTGNGQVGTANQELPSPLVVEARDDGGLPVVGQLINFRVVEGGGSMFAGAGITNAEGRVQDRWTMGPGAGAPNVAEARAVDPETGEPIVFARFTATTARSAIASLVAGGVHACALTDVGAAYCWGDNTSGGIGDGTMSVTRSAPTAVTGGLTFAQLTAGTNGDNHTCGLTAGGQAYCWGRNDFGQLGDGTTTNRVTPTAVTGSLAFSRLTAGGGTTCGLTGEGQAYCWGHNAYGQLGDGTTTYRHAPTAVAGGLTFTALTANQGHTCGLTASGAAYCWGFNEFGALGDGTTTNRDTPVAVTGSLSFTALTAGSLYTCGLTSSGDAHCWGDNQFGQLGDGTNTQHLAPTPVSGNLSFASLTTGDHTCGRTGGGQAHCWGHNNHGQLGDGTTTNRDAPTVAAPGLDFSALTAGNSYTCGLVNDSEAYCWGENQHGELGDGSTTDRLTPTPIAAF